jgi:hypothetical protein
LPNEPNPYTYNFELEMQKELTRADVFKVGYYGSRTRKLIRTVDVNRLNPGDTFDGTQDKIQHKLANGTVLATPIPTGNNRFNRIFIPLPDVNASFDSMVASWTHRLSNGLQLNANYSWSHTIDTGSYEIGFQPTDPSNQLIDRGNSDFDVRNNFSMSVVYQEPFFRSANALLKNTLGGWVISGIISKHSGFPWSPLIGSCDTNNDRNGDGYCPDAPFAYFGGMITKPTKQQWINGVFPNPKTSFDVTTKGPGARARNILPGPGYTAVDMSLEKNISLPFREGAALSLRANAFNVFNILNLSAFAPATAPTDILNTGQFGKAQNANAGRVVEFQLRLSF